MKNGVIHLFIIILLLTLTISGCTAPSSQPSPSNSPPQLSPQPSSLQELPGSLDSTEIQGIPLGRGQFVFNDSLGNADRPITVYTYRPVTWNQSGPVLIVIPGADRNGRSSRFMWVRYAEQYSSLLIVPEFSLEYYPTDYWYHLGNTYDSTNQTPKMNWTPKAKWTYTAIEHLFDYTREKSGATRDTYLLFGHSAGAQFVHRMVTLLPEARYSRAVAANSGVYLLPEYSDPYPFGLKDSPVYNSNLSKVFARKLIIMSGGRDTDPNAGDLANFPEAEAQGSTRFERARFYFTTAQSEAGRLRVPLNWEYHVVPGVGHDEVGMAGPSAKILFNET
jgi:pimeloyl-ACP methyl ester carboxylesterase